MFLATLFSVLREPAAFLVADFLDTISLNTVTEVAIIWTSCSGKCTNIRIVDSKDLIFMGSKINFSRTFNLPECVFEVTSIKT